jgi:hypothetical protein
LATKVLPKAAKIAYGIGEVAALPIRIAAAMANPTKDYRGKNYDNTFQFKPKPLGFMDNKLDWTGKSASTKELFGFKSEPEKNAFETYGEVIPIAGFDFSTISGLGDEIAEGTEKAKNELESFVDKVKSQAERFRDALGLFDKATTEKISGERLFVRLKEQFKTLTSYASNMKGLMQRLGPESALFQDLLRKGPQASGQIAGLAGLDDFRLQEYLSLYNRKSDLSTTLGNFAAGTEGKVSSNVGQVIVNINGGVVTNNTAELVDLFTRQLKVQGVI